MQEIIEEVNTITVSTISVEPTVSVIVPIYNGQHTLWQCVKSITAQTYRNFEVILVDDGSTDWTPDMCDAFAYLDPRVHVIHQKNQGLSVARNNALNIAQGKYILFVDGDDHVEPFILQMLLNLIESGDYDIAICPAIIESANKKKAVPESRECVGYYDSHEMRMHYGDVNSACYVRVWGRLFKREIFEHLRFKPGALYEDMFLFPHLYAKEHSVIFGTVPGYYYVQHQGSITRYKKGLKDFQAVQAALELFDAFVDKDDEALSGISNKIYANLRTLQSCQPLIHGDGKEMYKDYRKEFKTRLQILKNKNLLQIKDIRHLFLLYV